MVRCVDVLWRGRTIRNAGYYLFVSRINEILAITSAEPKNVKLPSFPMALDGVCSLSEV